MKPRLWVVSELYYPEETSTGYLLTKIAEGLAGRFSVSVLCAQPTYSARGVRAPRRETRAGVDIIRCRATSLNKDRPLFRVLNFVTISASVFLSALLRFRRGDAVLVVTNPPLLPFVVQLACRLRGARCVLLIHDVYPEVLTAANLARPDSLLTGSVGRLTALLYRASDRIVVLGRDMEALVLAKVPDASGKVCVIENWADVADIVPAERAENELLARLGLSDRFVVQYAGNMGRTHWLEGLLQGAIELRDESDVHFLFIGSGAKREWVEDQVSANDLENVTVLGSLPRSEQQTFLNACDVAIISFLPGMAGVSVPSRMYNILAAAKPILAVADESSELAQVVREENVGWVVQPGRSSAIAEIVSNAKRDRSLLRTMGSKGRSTAESKYTLGRAVHKYERLFEGLIGGQ